MPGWPNREPDQTGDTLGASVLRMLAHGFLLTGLGIALGAAFGVTTSYGIGTAAVACMASVGCGYAADAVQNAAIHGRKRLREEIAEDIERENAATAAYERSAPVLAAAASVAELRSDHALRLAQQREQRDAGHGRAV
jgi:hypothetical protein